MVHSFPVTAYPFAGDGLKRQPPRVSRVTDTKQRGRANGRNQTRKRPRHGGQPQRARQRDGGRGRGRLHYPRTDGQRTKRQTPNAATRAAGGVPAQNERGNAGGGLRGTEKRFTGVKYPRRTGTGFRLFSTLRAAGVAGITAATDAGMTTRAAPLYAATIHGVDGQPRNANGNGNPPPRTRDGANGERRRDSTETGTETPPRRKISNRGANVATAKNQ